MNALNTTFGIGGIHQTLVSCSWKESWLNAHNVSLTSNSKRENEASKSNSKKEERIQKRSEERRECIRVKICKKLREEKTHNKGAEPTQITEANNLSNYRIKYYILHMLKMLQCKKIHLKERRTKPSNIAPQGTKNEAKQYHKATRM